MRGRIITCSGCGEAAVNRGHGLCRNCYARWHRSQNLDKVRAYSREWQRQARKKNPERYRDASKKRRDRHHDKLLTIAKNYYWTHREQKSAYDREYRNKKRFGGNWFRVIERDNNKCRECGKSGRLLVHHLDKKDARYYKAANNDLGNLITLCFACHALVHHRGAKKKIIDTQALVAAFGQTKNIHRLAKQFGVAHNTIRVRLAELGVLPLSIPLRKGAPRDTKRGYHGRFVVTFDGHRHTD